MAGIPSSGASDRPSAEAGESAQTESKPSHQQLLEQVLQATLSLGPGDDALKPEELRALAAVARHRQSEPLSVDTVTELVQAILRLRFRGLTASRDQWERMTRQIAETMYQDPQTLLRLESLWAVMREAAV